jgi:hypothetical protein
MYLLTQLALELRPLLAVQMTWEKYKAVTTISKPNDLSISRGLVGILSLYSVSLVFGSLHCFRVITLFSSNDTCYAGLYSEKGSWAFYGLFWMYGLKPLCLLLLWLLSGLICFQVKRKRSATESRVSGGESTIQMTVALVLIGLGYTFQYAVELVCFVQCTKHSLFIYLELIYFQSAFNPFLHTIATKQFRLWVVDKP